MTDNTDDLLKKLKKAHSSEELEKHITAIEDRSFKDLKSYLESILRREGMSVADLQRKSYIDRTYIYQIMDGTRSPGRDKIIAIAVALRMTLEETQRALAISTAGILYAKSKRDSIIIYAIENDLGVTGLNALLAEYEEPQLD